MQKVINLSKHSVFMCKSQTDQWDTNGKMNMTLENRKKKEEKKKEKDLSSYLCKNRALCFLKNIIMIPNFIIVKKTLFLLTLLQQ